jgi:hypothetical protein
MITPDEKAAAFDPDAAPPPPVSKVGDLTSAHIGLLVEVAGVAGELIAQHTNDAITETELGVQEPDRPFVTYFVVPSSAQCKIIDEDLVQLTDVVTMDDFYELARELDRVSKAIRSNKAEIEALNERKRQLSDKMLGTFAQVGQSTLAFDDRRAYTYTEVIPDFEEKDDGSKYTYQDLVPVLKSLGREEQVTPETVNYKTLQGILREIRDGDVPMPPELAKMVKIGERVEVRVGVGRKSKR